MKKNFTLFKTLLVAVGLCTGVSAWAENQIFTEDFSDETYNVSWGGTSAGGVSPAVVEGGLKVANGSQSGDRSAYIAFGKNAYTGCCRLTFDMAMTGSNWSGKNNYFHVLPSASTARYPDTASSALSITQDNSGAITIAGESVGTFNGTTLTYDLYLNTITHKAHVVVKNGATEVKTISYETSATGINTLNLQFNKNNGAFVIDNISFYSLTAPAFTLSSTEETVSVNGTSTVDVTGITGDISVSSDNQNAATASYENGVVTIEGKASGVAYITVTATNDGLVTSQSIAVTVGEVSSTTVTVNYLDENNTSIATSLVIEDVVVGSVLTTAEVTYESVLYGTGFRYVNPVLDQTLPYTVVENGVINVTYTSQATVTSVQKIVKLGDTEYSNINVALDGKYVGDNVSFSYPVYINNGGTLYTKAANSQTYSQSFALNATGQECVLTYTATTINNIVFHSEGEEIDGATATSAGTNMNGRSSNQACGYAASDITLATLPAGQYKATIFLYANSSAGTTLKFQFGETLYDAIRRNKADYNEGATNGSAYTKEFVLTSTADVKWLQSGGTKDGLDYIYIQRIGDIPSTVSKTITEVGWATYYSPYPLDFTSSGLTAYIVKGVQGDNTTLTMEPVTAVPANTAVLLKGKAGDHTINVGGSAGVVSGNVMEGVTEATVKDANTIWVLMNDDTNGLGFYCNAYDFTVGANTAYIPVDNSNFAAPTSGAKARFFALDGGNATAINGIESEKNADNAAIYNLAGQRVNAGYKGIVIKNGKKYMNK